MLNVTAGIGVLGQASVMIQEMFSSVSVGEERAVSAAVAGGFVGLLSLFNMIGRFLWSSLSDRIGRKNTYHVFFLLGAALYVAIPTIGDLGSILFFVVFFGIIITMYGGGFATIPAYLGDLFGTSQVGAIHGRLLLAWSAAAILGPVLINYIRAYQIETLLLPPAEVYSITMYIMAGLLMVGFISNSLVKPVAPEHFIAQDPTANLPTEVHNSKKGIADSVAQNTTFEEIDKIDLRMPLAWLFIGIPLLWGVTQTLIKSLALFI